MRLAVAIAIAIGLVLAAIAAAALAAEVRTVRGTLAGPVVSLTLAGGDVVAATYAAGGDRQYWHILVSADHIVAEPVAAPAQDERRVDMLPDGVMVEGHGELRRAWLAEPTRRYRHGVLGDDIEAGALGVETADGRLYHLRLRPDSVFEDRYPRLADVDGDGIDDLVVVRSYLEAGAALAVYHLGEHGLAELAESEPIGTPNRWLNPVGAADFDGDGEIELAAVVTPHIGGMLTLYRREGEKLVVRHSAPGFSNHRIGSRELGLSAVADLDGDDAPEIAVPGTDRDRLRIVSFTGGSMRELAAIDQPAEIVTAILAADVDADGRADLVYGLSDGTLAVSMIPGERQ